mmetsp:Transcript_60254/g.159251  ORF Transcript_60254/g.159251 Transcript_60254/m.159251 type:complete len:265 (-) Transcript_60254:791-1585(-)
MYARTASPSFPRGPRATRARRRGAGAAGAAAAAAAASRVGGAAEPAAALGLLLVLDQLVALAPLLRELRLLLAQHAGLLGVRDEQRLLARRHQREADGDREEAAEEAGGVRDPVRHVGQALTRQLAPEDTTAAAEERAGPEHGLDERRRSDHVEALLPEELEDLRAGLDEGDAVDGDVDVRVARHPVEARLDALEQALHAAEDHLGDKIGVAHLLLDNLDRRDERAKKREDEGAEGDLAELLGARAAERVPRRRLAADHALVEV